MTAAVLKAITAGLASGLLFLVAAQGSALSLITGYVAPMPIIFAGLALGPQAVLVAAGSAILPVGFLLGLQGGAVFGFCMVAPALLLARLALTQKTHEDGTRIWLPTGLILAALTALGAMVLSAAGFLLMMEEPGLAGSVTVMMRVWTDTIGQSLPMEVRDQLVDQLSVILPGMAATGFVLLTVLNGVIAQALAVRFGKAIRPKPRYAALRLPNWLATLLVVSALVALAGPGDLGYLGRNLAIALASAFVLQALALAHVAVRRTPVPGLLLGLAYGVLIFGGLTVFMTAALIGLVEQWLDLRSRFSGPAAPGNGS